ncbi:hypothetical protein HN51_022720 [Arachis hypogaea]|uniref:Uncharacterized protein n=1 Tax=Arachis hypogaea TaxID=3818 RepID=A0A445EB21_ARAHY|nr:uncharacterized protein LOC112749634 [Arachis hypogaea]QHO54038.1 uncharacterized protein DS421_2g53170 [Arachis hypogaea]RYR72651.1 hypothetical protein Ahy_A02g006879 [Arachis hypogaea]
MITLKTIHLCFTPTNSNHTRFHNNTRTSSALCLCTKSNNDESDSSQPPQQPEGNAQSQELLAQIAMLQAQKVRLTGYLDEKSEYLTQFGEEAKAEFDKIGADALKGLDEASDRITASIESQMLEFEELNELNRLEIEENENKLVEFEDQMERDQNEGLFFKSLGGKKESVADKAKVKDDEVKRIELQDLSREKDGGSNKTLKNVYLFFIGLLTFGIVNSIGTDWRKVAVLGAILVVLFSLFINEQNKDNNKD